MGREMRADAKRSRAAVLEAAHEIVRLEGADMSLEAVARKAGVGSATLHRHFPSRRRLLQAIFTDDVERLCAQAPRVRAETATAEQALEAWIDLLVATITGSRGIGFVLGPPADEESDDVVSCHAAVSDATSGLLVNAQANGTVRDGVTADDILSLAEFAGSSRDPERRAQLLQIVKAGLRR